jgi:putative transposase
MCRLLRVSKSGFYAWDQREVSARERADTALSVHIHAIHRRSRQTYGAPMIQAELSDDYDIHVGCKRVARLMRADGLRGATLRHYIVTTRSSQVRGAIVPCVAIYLALDFNFVTIWGPSSCGTPAMVR